MSFFEFPIEETPAPLTAIEFMRLFTPAEWIAIDTARATDPMVRYFMALFAVAESVRLDHPDTQFALGYFVQKGLLTSSRVAEIAPIPK